MLTLTFLFFAIIYITAGFWLYQRAVKADMPDALLIRFIILWDMSLVVVCAVTIAAGVLLS